MFPGSLGKYIQAKGGIPVGGSDNNKLWECFTAGDKPVLITILQYWSGDASEYYQLVQVPPGKNLNGTLGMADINGSICITSGGLNIVGGIGTVAEPLNLQATVAVDRVGMQMFYYLLPPNYAIAVQPITAASSADFGVRIGGFELDA